MAIQTFTAGQILTSTQMNTLQQQAVMTFTTEAARDTALPTPLEGMVCYLTAPTVASTSLMIYNGSVWVDLVSKTAANATFNPAVGGYVNTATSVSVYTGTSALVTIMSPGLSNSGGSTTVMSFAVSGATTTAAADANGFDSVGATVIGKSRSLVVALTAGLNTFTIASRASGPTAQILVPSITVQNIL
jgi:hypothetical protein